jgi:hypothetical protein
MRNRHVVVQTAGGTWHLATCLWAHVGVTRRRERVVSDAELDSLEKTCDYCLGRP